MIQLSLLFSQLLASQKQTMNRMGKIIIKLFLKKKSNNYSFPHYTTCITFELWANNSGGNPYIKVGFLLRF